MERAAHRPVAIVLGVSAAALPVVALTVLGFMVPAHSNHGSWLYRAALAVPAILLLWAILGAAAFLSLKIAKTHAATYAAIFAALYTPVLGWRTVDAANVLLDRSPVVEHRVQFVEHVRPSKTQDYLVVTSWRTPNDTEKAYHWVTQPHRRPGANLIIRTRAGALGIEYSVGLVPAP